MVYILNIRGPSLAACFSTTERMIPFLKESNISVGVSVQRRLNSSAVPGGVEVFSRAGADQVMDTRGREGVAYNKRGGITPLKRIAARYFSTVDILLGIGYSDPGPAVAVYPEVIPKGFPGFDSSFLVAAVAGTPSTPLTIPVFSPGEEKALAELIRDRMESNQA